MTNSATKNPQQAQLKSRPKENFLQTAVAHFLAITTAELTESILLLCSPVFLKSALHRTMNNPLKN